MWPPFFSFSIRKGLKFKKKSYEKRHKRRVHVFTCCSCTWTRAQAQTISNSLGDQTLHMLKVWWSLDFIWTCYGYMDKVLLLLYTQKQMDAAQFYYRFTTPKVCTLLKIRGGPLAHHCWPPAQSWMPLCVVMTLEDLEIFLFEYFDHLRSKKLYFDFFLHVSTWLEYFLTEKEKNRKNKKKFCLVLEDAARLIYFMTFIPKFHVLASRGKKSGNLNIFLHVLAILEDFLTEKQASGKVYSFKCMIIFRPISQFWNFQK